MIGFEQSSPIMPSETEIADEKTPADEAVHADGASTASPSPALEADGRESELASLREELLRRRAEFENFRRRSDKDQRLAVEDAITSLLASLLPPIDALDLSLTSSGTLEDIRRGVDIASRDLRLALEARGVQVDDPVGKPFDPTKHQALSYEPAPGFADGTIARCFRRGYVFGDRVIRPALVLVAQAEGAEPAAGPEEEASHEADDALRAATTEIHRLPKEGTN